MLRIPKRLRRPPLIEAVFEVRFSPRADIASELIPGLLFPVLKSRFPKSEQTQLGAIPKALRAQSTELRYSHTFKFHGNGSTALLGDHVMGLSVVLPYPGWAEFRQSCRFVVEAIRDTGYIG